MTYLLLSIAPGIAICLYFFIQDAYNREPLNLLFKSFLFGAIMVLPAALIENFFSGINNGTLIGLAFYAFCIVGVTEEGVKFICVRFFTFLRKEFDEPLDGIVYSVMASMGFATIENLFYVLGAVTGGNGWTVGIERMIFSVPAHASFAMIMGYFIGLAKFNLPDRFKLLTEGLLLSAFFHGMFDFFIFLSQNPNHLIENSIVQVMLFVLAITSFIIAFILGRKLFKQQHKLSQEVFDEKKHNLF